MAMAWKDSVVVILLSNVFSSIKDPILKRRKKAREAVAEKDKSSLNENIGHQATGILPIPLIIDTYNQEMGGIDIADYYRSLSQINHRHFCREPAQALIFDFLLSITITNCILIMRETKRRSRPSGGRLKYSSTDFRTALFEQLIAKFCAQAEQQRGPTMGQIKRVSPRAAKPTTTGPAADHTLHNQGRLSRERCKACSKRFRQTLGDLYSRRRHSLKTMWYCRGCTDSYGKSVPLHSDGDCFEMWHSASDVDVSPIVDVNSSFSSATTDDDDENYFNPPPTPTPGRRLP